MTQLRPVERFAVTVSRLDSAQAEGARRGESSRTNPRPLRLLLEIPDPSDRAGLADLLLRVIVVCRRRNARLRAIGGTDLAELLVVSGLADLVAPPSEE